PQTRTDRSGARTARARPSGEKLTPTGPPSGPEGLRVASTVIDTVATFPLPGCLGAGAWPSWPDCLPLATSQSVSVPSPCSAATVRPSGENAKLVMGLDDWALRNSLPV